MAIRGVSGAQSPSGEGVGSAPGIQPDECATLVPVAITMTTPRPAPRNPAWCKEHAAVSRIAVSKTDAGADQRASLWAPLAQLARAPDTCTHEARRCKCCRSGGCQFKSGMGRHKKTPPPTPARADPAAVQPL
jgi:hypothetical protein